MQKVLLLKQIMLIDFRQVCLQRSGRQILRDVTLSLSEQRVGIIGPNGSGKSTLARLVNGLAVPSSGMVLFNGVDVAQHLKQIRRQVGFLFQNPDNQIVFPLVAEDLDFGLKARLSDSRARQTRIEQTLAQIGIENLMKRSVHELSGGEKQLVALAAVLCVAPDVLVFDEPTTQLDLRYKNRFQRIISGLPQPIVMVTHDLDLLKDFDRVIVMIDGQVAHDSQPATALNWYVEQMGVL